jgi:hypothetical protein
MNPAVHSSKITGDLGWELRADDELSCASIWMIGSLDSRLEDPRASILFATGSYFDMSNETDHLATNVNDLLETCRNYAPRPAGGEQNVSGMAFQCHGMGWPHKKGGNAFSCRQTPSRDPTLSSA